MGMKRRSLIKSRTWLVMRLDGAETAKLSACCMNRTLSLRIVPEQTHNHGQLG